MVYHSMVITSQSQHSKGCHRGSPYFFFLKLRQKKTSEEVDPLGRPQGYACSAIVSRYSL